MKIFAVLLIGLGLVASTPLVPDSQYKAPFPIEFYFDVAETAASRNLIVSPASVTTCLILAYLGSGGKTAEEFHSTLQFSDNSKTDIAQRFGGLVTNLNNMKTDNLEFSMANRIYVDQKYEISPTYNEMVSKYFNASADTINFEQTVEAAKTINNWVKEKTHNKIKDIVKPSAVDASTAAVLVNAVYFKAPWRNTFSEYKTKKHDFHLSKTEKIQVDMMNVEEEFEVADWSHIDATAIRIPYANSNIYMLIILPNEIDGLADMEKKFRAANHAHMQTTPRSERIDLTIPKFKFDFEIKLNEVLEKMGLSTMFTTDADFSSLLKTPQPLQISEVVHKAFISIDENGTEAAGATGAFAVKMARIIPPDEPRKIVVDRPFMFAIRDQGNVYFAGHVVDFN